MEQWKISMRAGNQCFEAQQYNEALSHYEVGGERAKQLFTVWFDRPQAVASVVVSYHNLADLYLAMGQPEPAERQLRHCYDYLFTAVADAGDLAEVDESLLQGLRRSYGRLIAHIRLYGTCLEAVPALSQLPLLAANDTQRQREPHNDFQN